MLHYFVVLMLRLTMGLSSACVGDSGWKAGVTRVVITPEAPVWLAGYGTKRVPDGKLHDLWLKVLALEDPQGCRAVLVTTDFQGIPRGMYESMAKSIGERYKLDRSQVMFTFSHNHCGPRLRDDLVDYYPVEAGQVALVERYTDLMASKTVDAVGRALASLAPVGLSMGQATAAFAVNRRNNREADVPGILSSGKALQGPVDHAVPVLTVRGADGKLVAVVFGYACHATTLSFTKWCGDYPGFAQAAIEKIHPGVTAMFIGGCGADQDPFPRMTVELCERYGGELAEAVENALSKPMKPIRPGVRTAFEFVELPYLKNVSREELVAGATSENVIYARWAARMLNELEGGKRFSPAYLYPVQAWRLGEELLLIGLGGEAVVDYALRLKKEFGPETWVCGYANSLVAYIPSRRVWDEGGYEGGSYLYEYGHPAVRWGGDVEERIIASIRRLTDKKCCGKD